MKKLLLSFLFVLFTVPAWSQTGSPEGITILRRGGENTFYQDGLPVSRTHAAQIMAINPDAHKAMRRANTNYGFACGVGFVGGFGIGWGIGSAIFSDFQWEPLAAGAAVLALVIPFLQGYNKQSAHAVEIYNRGLGLSSGFKERKTYLAPASSGVGLALRF